MNWKNLFFDWKGRIGRRHYWLGMMLAFGPLFLLALINDLILLATTKPPLLFSTTYIFWPVMAWTCIGLYIAAIASSKRLHDRGHRNGWLIALLAFPILMINYNGLPIYGIIALKTQAYLKASGLSPAIAMAGVNTLLVVFLFITLWLFIELGFLRGTTGPNKYGPDPLALTRSTVPPAKEDSP